MLKVRLATAHGSRLASDVFSTEFRGQPDVRDTYESSGTRGVAGVVAAILAGS
jgi:hypothetical protein